MFPSYDAVCVLLETPFSKWNNDDKRDFLSCKKPMPVLNVNKTTKVKDKVYNRRFKEAWYSEFKWLCGSYYLNKFFCVPCLITGDKASLWNKNGFNDFGNIARALHHHDNSSDHIHCAIDFSQLRKSLKIEDNLNEDSRVCIKRFNETVQLNRRFMQLPIRAVLYLGKHELALSGHHEDNNRRNFKEQLESLVAISPVDIQEHYKKIKPLFTGIFCETLQIDIIDSISQYIDKYVVKEIQECNFCSIHVNDSTNIAQKPQCSIIIRYVKNPDGKLVERFLGFYDISSNWTPEELFNIILGCLEKFDYKSKLIGQCFDGANLVSGQLNVLQSKVKEVAPRAVFVHCLAHHLNLVLQQSCNRISKCRIFFATISCLPTFFQHCVKGTHIAGTIFGRGVPTSVIDLWMLNSKILSIINIKWRSLKQVFIAVMNDHSSDQASVRQSENFLNKFNDFEFSFLVIVFSEILPLTNVLFGVLQEKSFDINNCVLQVNKTQSLLDDRRNETAFRKIFELASLRTSVPTDVHLGGMRVTLTLEQVLENYKTLYYEIIDTISEQITTRFDVLKYLQFVTLMDTSKFAAYFKTFPTKAVSCLKMRHSNTFTDFLRLKNELQFIYGNKQYRDIDPKVFMKILAENSDVFRETYKLFCLIVTIPCINISVEHSSGMQRVETYLRNTKTEERPTNLSKLSIEKELLNELIDTQPFYDDIIDEFASLMDRTIDLRLSSANKTKLDKKQPPCITNSQQAIDANSVGNISFIILSPSENVVNHNNYSQPSTSSSGPPSVETFIKDEPSCSQEEVLDTAPTFELLPEQTEQPLSMATRSKPYTGSSDKVYCRLCLKPAHQTSLTPLSPVDFHHPEKDEALKKKKLEEIEEVNKMLKFCFPFYDSLTFGPVICSSCLARLKLCYEFSTECLKSQQLVEKYADKYCTTERLINLDEMIEKMSDDEKAVPDIPNVSSSRVSRKKRHSNEDSSPAKKQRVDHETQEEDYSSDSSDEETSIIKFEPDDDDSCTLSERLKKETDDDDSCALSKRLKKEPDDDDDAFTEDLPHDTRQSYVIDPNKFDEEIKVESMYIDHPDYIKDEPVDDLFIDNREFNERTNIGIDIRKQQPHFHETKNVPAPVSGQVFSNVGSSLGDSTSDVIK